MSVGKKVKLGQLKPGVMALIVGVGDSLSSLELTQRLLEMGFLEGSSVEIVHEAPFWGDPLAIRVRGTLVALRRQEANFIEVLVYE